MISFFKNSTGIQNSRPSILQTPNLSTSTTLDRQITIHLPPHQMLNINPRPPKPLPSINNPPNQNPNHRPPINNRRPVHTRRIQIPPNNTRQAQNRHHHNNKPQPNNPNRNAKTSQIPRPLPEPIAYEEDADGNGDGEGDESRAGAYAEDRADGEVAAED